MPPKKVVPPKTTSKPSGKTGVKGSTVKKANVSGKSQPKGAAAAPPPPPPPPEVTSINLKELQRVIGESISGKIRDSKKWPLIIDLQGSVSTFVKYRDANYLQSQLPGEMTPERLRMALLGSLRFGKPFVIDVGEHDVSDIQMIEEVEKGLLDLLLDHTILEEDKYRHLVKPGDDADYNNSHGYNTDGFCFLVITNTPEPNPTLANRFTCFKVE